MVEVIEVPEEMFEKAEEVPKEVKKPILPVILISLAAIIVIAAVITIILYQLRKRPRKVSGKKKKFSNKEKAKALTKFILNCRKRKIPKKEIKKLLIKKGWPEKIINEYLKGIFSK